MVETAISSRGVSRYSTEFHRELPADALAEYESLRGEIERRSNVQQAVVVLNLAGVVAAAGIVAKIHEPVGRMAFLLTFPMLSYALARLWLDHHGSIGGIGSYIRSVIEPGSHISWETVAGSNGVPDGLPRTSSLRTSSSSVGRRGWRWRQGSTFGQSRWLRRWRLRLLRSSGSTGGVG
jgi:hypothetical protein